MTKILHLITDLDTGGAEMMLLRLVSNMKPQCFENIVVSMTDDGVLLPKFNEQHIKTYSLGMKRGVPSLGAFLKLLRILRLEKPHIVQTWLYHSDLIGLLAARICKNHCVVWNLRCADMDLRQYGKLTRMVVAMNSLLSDWPALVLANSKQGMQYHTNTLGYKPRKSKVVPNGFSTDVFFPDRITGMNLKKSWLSTNETIIIGMVARYDPMKDHHTFLKALELIKLQQLPVDFRAVMAGRNVDWENAELVKWITQMDLSENVVLLGEYQNIPLLMNAFDIYCSSSRSEGFPNVIGEAMACGLPCVVTDAGDSALLLSDKGIIVPAGNVEELASALINMIYMSDEDRQELGAKARQHIIDNYEIGLIVGIYEEIFLSLVNSDITVNSI